MIENKVFPAGFLVTGITFRVTAHGKLASVCILVAGLTPFFYRNKLQRVSRCCPVPVAFHAGGLCMFSGKGEVRSGMIEGNGFPFLRCMACLAARSSHHLAERSFMDVVMACCTFHILEMEFQIRRPGFFVARGAQRCSMGAAQREPALVVSRHCEC